MLTQKTKMANTTNMEPNITGSTSKRVNLLRLMGCKFDQGLHIIFVKTHICYCEHFSMLILTLSLFVLKLLLDVIF